MGRDCCQVSLDPADPSLSNVIAIEPAHLEVQVVDFFLVFSRRAEAKGSRSLL